MTLGPRPALVLTLPALASALLMLAQPAGAQTEPAKADAGLERAQKAADAVFHWIKLNGDKGANRSPTNPAPAPAPAPVARKAAPAPTPVAAAPRPALTPAPTPTQTAAAPADGWTSPAAQGPAPAPAAMQEPSAVMLASAPATSTPDAPLTAAAKAVEPPAPEPEEDDEGPLQLLSKVNPVMPRQLPPTFTKGIAQVQFTIAPNGHVSAAQVLKATHGRLGTAAMDAVKQWRFAPIPKERNVAIEIAFSKEES